MKKKNNTKKDVDLAVEKLVDKVEYLSKFINAMAKMSNHIKQKQLDAKKPYLESLLIEAEKEFEKIIWRNYDKINKIEGDIVDVSAKGIWDSDGGNGYWRTTFENELTEIKKEKYGKNLNSLNEDPEDYDKIESWLDDIFDESYSEKVEVTDIDEKIYDVVKYTPDVATKPTKQNKGSLRFGDDLPVDGWKNQNKKDEKKSKVDLIAETIKVEKIKTIKSQSYITKLPKNRRIETWKKSKVENISWHKESQYLFGDEVLPFLKTSIWARKDELENVRIAGDEIEISYNSSAFAINNYALSSVKHNFFNKIQAYREANHRHFMLKAIEMMYEQKKQTDKLYANLLQVEPALKMKQQDFPIIGAVLVNKNKQIVASAYKGCECDDFDSLIKHHCEYLLFNHVLKNKEDAIGGTLYCTLEPCNKRGIEKLPCAIHCLESGIDEIFVGLLDPNSSDYKRGIKILSEGIFWVEDNSQDDHIQFLENRLGNYPKCFSDESGVRETGYIIREGGIKVNMFHGDLVAEILRTNLNFYKPV